MAIRIEKTDKGDWFLASYDWSDFPHYTLFLGSTVEWIGTAFTLIGSTVLALNIMISPWAYPAMFVGSAVWFLVALRQKNLPLAAMQGYFCILNLVGTFRWLT